ncbi:hypothetical protein GEMRC1_006832 [Eukaryota sp. GEM-RC1]
MTKHQGVRRGTRYMFQRDYKKNGVIPLTNYMQIYKLGDSVDIRVNGAIQKGMPHKDYHGKTGRVWNVSRRAIGIEVNKRVRTRIMVKRIHARLEHIKPSKCNDDFKKRCTENLEKANLAKKTGVRVPLKRSAAGPRDQEVVDTSAAQIIEVRPLAYNDVW